MVMVSNAPARAVAKMPLNIIMGVPDDRLCSARAATHDGNLKVTLVGTACIIDMLPGRFFAPKIVNLDPGPIPDPLELGPGPFLNHIADPDRCEKTLLKLAKLVKRSRRACFNHPQAVLETYRDRVAQSLSGIPRLAVPQTIRLIAQEPEKVADAIDQAGLGYPVIVRIAGDHGGVSMMKIDDSAGLSEIYKLNCYDKAIYVTQFHDFVSADGRYRKFRVAVVGGKILLRHMLVGDNWLLHAERRGKNTEAEEARMLENFDEHVAPHISPVFKQITERLDLDYFGVDCNITEEGEVTLFEANACMNIMANTSPSPNMWDKPIVNIKRALFGLLRSPKLWRHPPQSVAA